MEIKIGDTVMGKSGKLGEVERIIVEHNHLDRVSELVVKHGFLFGSDRVVPVERITRIEDGVVYLDLDEKGFAALDGFAGERYHGPRDEPPEMPLFAEGMLVRLAESEHVEPDHSSGDVLLYDAARADIRAGMNVLDINGIRLGETGEVAVASETGRPTHVRLRRGYLFRHDLELPLDWVARIAQDGVQLNVSRDRVAALEATD
jgi:uncharacterized protein YrrD